jgi:hypothetical protein
MKHMRETIAVLSLSEDIFMAAFTSLESTGHDEGNSTRYAIRLTPKERVTAENIFEAYKQTVFALEQLLLARNIEIGGFVDYGRPYVERPLAVGAGPVLPALVPGAIAL